MAGKLTVFCIIFFVGIPLTSCDLIKRKKRSNGNNASTEPVNAEANPSAEIPNNPTIPVPVPNGDSPAVLNSDPVANNGNANDSNSKPGLNNPPSSSSGQPISDNDDSGSGNDDSGSGNDDSGSDNDDSGSENDDSGSSDNSGSDDPQDPNPYVKTGSCEVKALDACIFLESKTSDITDYEEACVDGVEGVVKDNGLGKLGIESGITKPGNFCDNRNVKATCTYIDSNDNRVTDHYYTSDITILSGLILYCSDQVKGVYKGF